MLVKEPIVNPSIVFEFDVVGSGDVLQQTPLTDTSVPPLDVIFPPPIAVDEEAALIGDVVTVGFDAITTFNVLSVLEPHELSAVTEIVPPLAPAVAAIDVDVELPLHPDGNVHV